MSITIKSVYGDTLYTATNAQDVREALREALRSRADLYRANLSRANLSGASLSRANLYGADLSGADLSGADLSRADLSRANLYGADLSGADLSRADLSRANLYGANLSGADLSGADLSRANLSRANLYGADLSGAKGVNPYRQSPLHILADQPGRVRAYKLVTAAGEGPFRGGITYEKGQTYEVPNAETDPNVECGVGIHVASLDWCIQNWVRGYRILVVEFTAKDIACIPHGTDGKFRVRKVRVVGEKDLAAIGLSQ